MAGPTVRARRPPLRTRLAAASVLAVTLTLAGCSAPGGGPAGQTASGPVSEGLPSKATVALPSPAPTPSASPTPEPTPEPEVTFTLLAAGDVLPHATVLRTAQDGDGGWDFSPMWETVTPWIASADLAICHLEVPLTADQPEGYPQFSSPVSLAQDLREAGWNGCSTGSNHSLDRRFPGVVSTLDALEDAGLGHAGTSRSEAESEQVTVYEVTKDERTLRVAQLGGTYGTNGIPLPSDAPWSVELLDGERLVGQARAARGAGADVVIASLHWGTEYADSPDSSQRELARVLADSGEIDLVIGTHPHVPQPIEVLPGGPDGRGMPVAFSLGNFISNQDAKCCRPETATGLLLWVSIVDPPQGQGAPYVSGVEWSATTVDRVGGQRVYPLEPLQSGEIEAPGLTLTTTELAERAARVRAVVDPGLERLEPLPEGSTAQVTVTRVPAPVD